MLDGMTREEAMLWLVSLAEHEGEEVPICAEDAKALQMGIDAIKALEQQPILDTRQRERQLEMEYQHGYDKGWEEGRKVLEQQPKTGHWIQTDNYFSWRLNYVECSCCHKYSLEEGDYCPNCGTRMEVL